MLNRDESETEFPSHNDCQLIEVEINSSRAKGGVTNILLDGWLGPAPKGGEVAKGGPIVVVRVPQRIRLELSGATADGVPLTG